MYFKFTFTNDASNTDICICVIVSKTLVCPVVNAENYISENLYQRVFKKLSFQWPKMLFICVEKGRNA